MISALFVVLIFGVALLFSLVLVAVLEHAPYWAAHLIIMAPVIVVILWFGHMVASTIVCKQFPYLSECIK